MRTAAIAIAAMVLFLACAGLGVGLLLIPNGDSAPKPCTTPNCPVPDCPAPPSKPKKPKSPWGDQDASVGASVGGPVSPDGVKMQAHLPGSLHQKNIAAKGLGCCVFRSLDHAARLQNVPALINMPEWMVQKGIEGGGYPGKVDKLVPQIAKDRGYPTPDYVQVELTGTEAINFLTTGCLTGRMASVTYSKSPTGRYGGSSIAHMVNAAHSDGKWIAILDNNYIGDDAYEWVTTDEFLKICNKGGTVWMVFLLSAPPSPDPWN